MVDTENLRTASLYINNQLLSRGLLRDGQTVDFANVGNGGEESAATRARIISIVNDLILRRDRDAEHRESLSTAMRNLRAENLKHTADITRLTEKNAEEKRKADIAAASEAAMKTQLKSAESNVRGLKEEISRTKSLVAQTRTACATEVRRRDRQIDTLKKQLTEAGRSRGTRANPAITTITVTGDVGREKGSAAGSSSVAADDYDLRSETNAFLANLAQNLSEENETILNMMQRAMKQLREMSGYQGDDERRDAQVIRRSNCEELDAELDSVVEHMRNILTNPSFVPIEEVVVREEEIARLKSGWVKMETRWKEAVHLIDSWRRKMAASGKPLCDEELQMSLRLSPVRVHDVDETKQAFELGLEAVAEEDEEFAASLRSPCPPSNEDLDLVPEPSFDANEESGDIEYEDDDAPADYGVAADDDDNADAPSYDRPASPDSPPMPEPPRLSPLKNSASAGNRGSAQEGRVRSRPGDFSTIAEEKTKELEAEARSMRSLPVRPKGLTAQMRVASNTAQKPSAGLRSSSRSSLDDALLPKPQEKEAEASQEPKAAPLSMEKSKQEAPKQEMQAEKPSSAKRAAAAAKSDARSTPKRIATKPSLPRNANPPPQQSPLTMSTIAAKLAASEKEADAARVRAKLRAARGTGPSTRGGVKRPAIANDAETKEAEPAPVPPSAEDVDPVKHDPAQPQQEEEQQQQQPKPEKRKRERTSSKVTSRRRSTLSPWELETLMAGTAQ
ncbi:nima interactive protein [Purpureocillium lilacinum]|uniref:Nima interactive protein n=1 Tax=Purpureocillium lilacinum TaxID=33203 RepID=A0A179GUJ9_PURLI|nr:nima interactive protein [Purpureocillium lilacinum]OAQ80983.1 nima interactive protein [Purpureocillium lilacinum]